MWRPWSSKAKSAAGRLSTLPTAVKNQALLSMADGLEEHATELLAENEKDLEQFDATPERRPWLTGCD